MEKNWLPQGYSIEEKGGLTYLFKQGLLVFYTFQKVKKERIKEIIGQIEEARKIIGVTEIKK